MKPNFLLRWLLKRYRDRLVTDFLGFSDFDKGVSLRLDAITVLLED